MKAGGTLSRIVDAVPLQWKTEYWLWDVGSGCLSSACACGITKIVPSHRDRRLSWLPSTLWQPEWPFHGVGFALSDLSPLQYCVLSGECRGSLKTGFEMHNRCAVCLLCLSFVLVVLVYSSNDPLGETYSLIQQSHQTLGNTRYVSASHSLKQRWSAR